ncbi:MAG: hypothetical protein KGV57_05025 [Fusobacterium sp.]|nr:hypothetical protein [Fusobacterium sp.]
MILKKVLLFLVLGGVFISCGDKFPYTSEKEKIELCEKSLKGEQKANDKLDKILDELRNRENKGDKKASEELKKFEKIIEDTAFKAFN